MRSLTAPSSPSASVGAAVVGRVGAPLVERAAHGAVRLGRRAQDLDPARDDLDADAAGQPAAADRHDDRLHVGELRQDLAREQAAVAGDHVVVVERRHEHQARIGGGAPARLGLGLVVGRARRPRPCAPSAAMPARLTSGVCADTSTVASTPKARAASATPRPWLPAEAAMTRGRSRPRSSASAAMRAAAPRSLNDPVRCRFSSFSQTSAPVRRPSAGAGHQRRHARQPADALRDLAAGDLAPDLRIEHARMTSRPATRSRDHDARGLGAVNSGMSFVVARPAGARAGRCPRRTPPRVEWLWDEIRRLKRDKRAFIPAHNYQVPEVQAIADTVGDSFELAVRARDIDAEPGRLLRRALHGRGLPHAGARAAGLPAEPARRSARWPRSTPTTWPSGRTSCARPAAASRR